MLFSHCILINYNTFRREKGIISAVRNQGLCGACWAFSTIHTIEAMYAKNYNLTSLSVQVISQHSNFNKIHHLFLDLSSKPSIVQQMGIMVAWEAIFVHYYNG